MPTILEAEEKLSDAGPAEKCGCIPDLSKQAAKLRADLDDAKSAATHFTKRARYAAEDVLDDVAHGIKHHPLSALGIAFGLGAMLGMILIGSPKTRKSLKWNYGTGG